MSDEKSFQYAKRMFPLFRAIVKFCSTNRFRIVRPPSWRCKSRINNNDYDIIQTSDHLPVEKRTIVTNCGYFTCWCGKSCKEVEGLKMHQRSCRVFNGLDDNLSTILRMGISESSTISEIASENDNSTNQTGDLQEN